MRIFILPGMMIGKLSSLPFILKIILKNRYGPQFNYEETEVQIVDQTSHRSQNKN